ncbi:hypothetical protein NUSPORA_01749 [Nucleospora cyclopteri]
MNIDSTKQNIKRVYFQSVQCKDCKQTATFEVIEISDKILPKGKIEIVTRCRNCNIHESNEYDMQQKDYGVVINCTFNNKEDLKRRCYLNNDCFIKIFDTNRMLIYEFQCNESYLDTVETLLLRAIDQLEEITDKKVNNETLDFTKAIKHLNEFRETGCFFVEIRDNTGFSRVFPRGITDIKKKEEDPIDEPGSIEYTINKKN